MSRKKMKVLDLMLSLVLAIGIVAVVAPVNMVASAKERVNIRVAVISDVHITGGSNPDGRSQSDWFKDVLTWYAQQGVDAVILAGDTVQGYTDSLAECEEQFKEFAEAWFSVFPNNTNPYDSDAPVEPIFVYGNHDDQMRANDDQKAANGQQTIWEKYMHEIYSPVFTKVVKGYYFVGASWSHEGSQEMADQIEAAVQASGNKPVFYVQHPHPSKTCYGSETWGDDNKANKVLKNYPTVIAFSGHSHFPLTDERSIWQGTYTSIGTASLHYVELEPGKQGGSVPANDTSMKQGSYMTVTDFKVNIERRNFMYDEKIGEDWVLDLPLSTTTFTYTDARADAAVAPQFPDGAKATVTNVGKNKATITFDAAKLESTTDILHSYVLEAVNKATGKIDKTVSLFSEFYLGAGRLGDSYVANMSGLTPETEYTVNIYALDCFQKRSQPISVDLTTSVDLSKTVDTLSPDVLDMTFLNGSIKDSSICNTPTELKGNAKVKYDESIGKYVLVLDGEESFLNCYLDSDQYASMRKQMSMEVIFKVNDLESNQAVVECTQSGGMGYEVTGDGEVDLWIYIGGEYFKVSGSRLAATVNDHQYHHLLTTFDTRSIYLYLDGKEVACHSFTSNKNITFNTGVAFALGADAEPAGEGQLFFNGNIALARLYSHGLSADEVKILYENAKSTKGMVSLYNVNHGKLHLYADEACTEEITDPTTVEKNDVIYVATTPDAGYKTDFITVNGEAITNGAAVNVNEQKAIRVLFVAEQQEEPGEESSEEKSEEKSKEKPEEKSDTPSEKSEASQKNPDSGMGVAGGSALAIAGLVAAAAAILFRNKEEK